MTGRGTFAELLSFPPITQSLRELINWRLNNLIRRLLLPNGLLQTFNNIWTQCYLTAAIADFCRYVIDQYQIIADRQTVSD